MSDSVSVSGRELRVLIEGKEVGRLHENSGVCLNDSAVNRWLPLRCYHLTSLSKHRHFSRCLKYN